MMPTKSDVYWSSWARRADGKKELIAVLDVYRESEQS
ncbi:hypothetical protein Mal65_29200 [Crateriforma conspicua]|nr:hypothetical protein Mal65_29200 [Crateriforma conspicua]